MEKNIDSVAEIFHVAWQDWVKYFLYGKHSPKDLAEWRQLLSLDYCDLDVGWKEKNRFYAVKVMEKLGK